MLCLMALQAGFLHLPACFAAIGLCSQALGTGCGVLSAEC